MKILVLEEVHFEVVWSIVRVLEKANHEITLYTTPKISSSFKKLQENNPQPTKIISKTSFLQKNEDIKEILELVNTDKIDAVFICTLQYKFLNYYHLLKELKTKKILTVHNVNTWLNPSILFNPKFLVRNYIRQLIFSKIDVINVISYPLKDYIEDVLNFKKKAVLVIPSTANSLINPPPSNSIIVKLVVPGTVDPFRRNYETIFNSLSKLKAYFPYFEIVLLGRLQTASHNSFYKKVENSLFNILKISNKTSKHNNFIQKVKNHIHRLSNDGLNITCFNNYVSEETFIKHMQEADVILAPTQVKTIFDGTVEIYGMTKCSGNINDMIKFRKPMIVPKELVIPAGLEKGCLHYTNERELTQVLEKLVKSRLELENLKNNAWISTEQYSLDNIAGSLELN